MDIVPTSLWGVFILLFSGCIGGFLNAIAGGGTLVTFPALIWLGLPSIPANATSAIALLPASLGSVAGYRNHLKSITPYLKVFAPVSFLGGLIGSILLVSTPAENFDSLAPFLILFATLLFTAQDLFFKTSQDKPHPKKLLGAILFQFLVSIYGGYFGAGIGILMLASLGMLGFNHVHQMNSLKVVLTFFINSIAALYFIASGIIYWQHAGVMAIGTIAGGYAGARIAQKIPQNRVRFMITIIGLIISTIMFYIQLFN